MKNPYLEEYLTALGDNLDINENPLSLGLYAASRLSQGKVIDQSAIADKHYSQLDGLYKLCYERDRCVKKYAWAIPNQEAIEELVKLSPIIELGAGRGYWASLVQAAGGDIVAYDSWINEDGDIRHFSSDSYEKTFMHVDKGDAEGVVELYADMTLFLCWPPYHKNMASVTLKKYMEHGGKTLVYVGESEGGCTADQEFFDLLVNIEPRYINIPTWPGVYDYMSIYSL